MCASTAAGEGLFRDCEAFAFGRSSSRGSARRRAEGLTA
jgi:hypothetical protein